MIMALDLKGKMIAANFGKRFASQIFTCRKATLVPAAAYEKNADDSVVSPSTAAEEVISPTSSATYWVPHPKTGVFVPADKAKGAGEVPGPPVSGKGGSALDETAWFRPLEDVEKPSPA